MTRRKAAPLPNMVPVPPTVFTNASVHLRVWFGESTNDFLPILPDEPVAAVGYAMVAATEPDGALSGAKLMAGAITADQLAPGAVTAQVIAPGAIGTAQLAPNTAAANLGASGSGAPALPPPQVSPAVGDRGRTPQAGPLQACGGHPPALGPGKDKPGQRPGLSRKRGHEAARLVGAG